jgi:methionyl-tRNA formyltransferase
LPQQKVILFGTGAHFSVAVLNELLSQGLKPLALVLPEYAPSKAKPDYRIPVDVTGGNNQFVVRAEQLSIPLIYLPEPSQSHLTQEIIKFNVDFVLLACWPYLLSSQIIGTASKAALNIHPSLLPKYRGADPVTAQIDRQEKNLGVSLHLLSQEFDQGDIISQSKLELTTEFPGRDAIEAEAARVGSGLFMKAINDFGSAGWNPRPQHQ